MNNVCPVMENESRESHAADLWSLGRPSLSITGQLGVSLYLRANRGSLDPALAQWEGDSILVRSKPMHLGRG